MTVTEALMVSSEDDQEKLVPQWLRPIVGAKFYSSCDVHLSKEHNYYCRVCMLSLCKDCKGQHDRSKHDILTVYKTSHMASLRIEDLKPLWDISGICTYTFNGWLVAFIYKRGSGISCSRGNKSIAKCESCQYGLKSPSTNYCSVECKVEAALKKMNGSGGSTTEKTKRKLESMLEEINHNVRSFRKRARKQKSPQRASSQ